MTRKIEFVTSGRLVHRERTEQIFHHKRTPKCSAIFNCATQRYGYFFIYLSFFFFLRRIKFLFLPSLSILSDLNGYSFVPKKIKKIWVFLLRNDIGSIFLGWRIKGLIRRCLEIVYRFDIFVCCWCPVKLMLTKMEIMIGLFRFEFS